MAMPTVPAFQLGAGACDCQLWPPSLLSKMPALPMSFQGECEAKSTCLKSLGSTAIRVTSSVVVLPLSLKPAGISQLSPPSFETQKPMVEPWTPEVAYRCFESAGSTRRRIGVSMYVVFGPADA